MNFPDMMHRHLLAVIRFVELEYLPTLSNLRQVVKIFKHCMFSFLSLSNADK